jgi:opacity protein-like surface antigen
MKHPRLSAIFVAVSAASLLMVSTAGIAAHKSTHKVAAQNNFKGEANFKAEVPPPCPPIMMLHDGFYLGVGLGYDAYKFHGNTTGTVTTTGTSTVIYSETASYNSAATGWMGGIFAGYGRYFDWAYLGLEINANTSNASGTNSYINNFGNASFKGQARTSYGIALLPGMKVNDSSLLYVRLGYLRTNFKGSFSDTNNVATTIGGVTIPAGTVSGSSSEWRGGFDLGIGIETYVAEDVSVRGEYNHTWYNSKSTSAVPYVVGTATVGATGKYTLSNNEYMLSLLYHFA